MHREHDNWSRTEIPIASFWPRNSAASLLAIVSNDWLAKNTKYIHCGPSSREVDEKTKRKYRTILYERMNNLLHLFHLVSFCRWIWCGRIAALCFSFNDDSARARWNLFRSAQMCAWPETQTDEWMRARLVHFICISILLNFFAQGFGVFAHWIPLNKSINKMYAGLYL